MKKSIAFLLAFLLFHSMGMCQASRDRVVSFELGIGGIQSFDKLFFDKVGAGLMPYAEIRYNFKNIPLEIGFGGSVQIFSRKTNDGEVCDFISKNLFLLSDYAFYRQRSMKVFAGAGLGLGYFDMTEDIKHEGYNVYTESGEQDYPICVMPRVGVELWRHLRISLGYLFEDRANRNLNLRIGYIF